MEFPISTYHIISYGGNRPYNNTYSQKTALTFIAQKLFFELLRKDIYPGCEVKCKYFLY